MKGRSNYYEVRSNMEYAIARASVEFLLICINTPTTDIVVNEN